MTKNADDYKSLLDYGREEPDASDENEDDEGNQKPEKDEDIEAIKKQLKDQQEYIRQQSETIKDLSAFKDKIVGPKPDEEEKQRMKELQMKYDQNPVGTTIELIEERLNQTNKRIEHNSASNMVEKAMRDIDRNYIVDWDKDYTLIVDQLNNFTLDARKKNPQSILLQACRMAGVIKKRSKPLPTHIEGEGRETGSRKPANKTEADSIKERFEKYAERKQKKNVFKI